MQKLMDPCSADAELHRLHMTCQNWGFFQLVNHGVPDLLTKKVSTEVKQWLNLPMEEKKKFWQRRDDIEGFGQAFVVSKEQKLDWGDMFYVTTLPKHLRKPFPFHSLPAQFRETLESYSASLETLAMKILTLMAKALGMDQNEMAEMFKDGWQQMRMNYYPPCAFLVNIGDVIEIVSNGVYKSIDHRATVNSEKERITIATFFSPNLDGELGPSQSLLNTSQSPPKFRRMNVAQYFKVFFATKLDGKSNLDRMRV
ncbi:Protein SRG1 [Linum perenne]